MDLCPLGYGQTNPKKSQGNGRTKKVLQNWKKTTLGQKLENATLRELSFFTGRRWPSACGRSNFFQRAKKWGPKYFQGQLFCLPLFIRRGFLLQVSKKADSNEQGARIFFLNSDSFSKVYLE